MGNRKSVRSQAIMLRLWQIMERETGKRRSRLMAATWFILTLASTLLGLFAARFLGQMVQMASESQLSGVIRLLAITALFAGGSSVVNALSTALKGRFNEDAALAFRAHSCKRIANTSYAWMESQKAGDLMERVGGNVQSALDYFTEHMPELFNIALRGSFLLVFVLNMNWQLGMIYLVSMPLVILLQSLLSKPAQKLESETLAAAGRATALAQDVLANIATVRAYGLEGEMDKRYGELNKAFMRRFKRSNRFDSITYPIGGSVTVIPSILLYLFAALFIFNGWFTLGGLITLIALCEPMNEIMWKSVTRFSNIRKSAAGAERIFEIWDAPQEKSAIGLPLEVEDENLLDFNDVTFGYRAEQSVLKNFSLRIRQGEKVALVGRSGCGKSTVLKLVSGLYKPTSGRIKLWSHDVSFAAPTSLRQYISYIAQDTYLFPESLRENIMLSKPDANQTQFNAACEAAQLDFVKAWPQGFDTIAGERGMQLSGGQRQRVAIARALLRDAQLILLDEATSALDTLAERQVQQALDRLLAGRSALIVAHRLSSIRHVDRIVVMDNGRIVEEGTHEQLMAYGGLYTDLYKTQTEGDVSA